MMKGWGGILDTFSSFYFPYSKDRCIVEFYR